MMSLGSLKFAHGLNGTPRSVRNCAIDQPQPGAVRVPVPNTAGPPASSSKVIQFSLKNATTEPARHG